MDRADAGRKVGPAQVLLGLSLAANLGLLGFFKYFGFFEKVVSDLFEMAGGGALPVVSMALPVGISFYTFESMSYVIDIYRGVAKPARSYLDYACFISFFPHLVAGPIIRYSDILHQFRDTNWVRKGPDWDQVDEGLLFLSIGMAKKLLVADQLALAIAPLWGGLREGARAGIGGELGGGARLHIPDLFRFLGVFGYGHRARPSLRGPTAPEFRQPLQSHRPERLLEALAYHAVTWLRDYLYIPLGGNRNGRQGRT